MSPEEVEATCKRWDSHGDVLKLCDEVERLRAQVAAVNSPQYAWHVVVLHLNHYGDKVQRRTPAVIHAATWAEVTDKVRSMFTAEYDSFRQFWSHGWTLDRVDELPRAVGGDRGEPASLGSAR